MNEFVVGIRKHNNIGYIASAYFAKKKNDNFYIITEPVTQSVVEKRPDEFCEIKRKIVKIIDAYSDNNLTIFFSKKKVNSFEFIKNIDYNYTKLRIRPFISKYLFKLFEILKDTNIKIFHKPDGYNTIYIEDLINVRREPAKTIFNIKRTNKGTKYFLSAKHLGKEINLTNKATIVLSYEPCLLILDNNLYFFHDIDAKKLFPFFNKKFIFIPLSSERKWFENFAVKAINKYDVKTEGFKFTHIQPEAKTVLVLEKDWKNRYVFNLNFVYDKFSFKPNNTNKYVVKFDIDEFCFRKFQRDFEQENQKKSYLYEIGLEKLSDSGFVIKQKFDDVIQQQYAMINWLSENQKLFVNENIKVKQSFFKKNYFIGKIKQNITVETRNDWFDIYGTFTFGKFEIPFLHLRNNIINEQKEFKLPDDTIFIIPEEWFAKYSNIFIFAKENQDKISLKKYYFNAVKQAEKKIKGLDKEVYKNLEKISSENYEQTDIPKEIKAKLRPYQKEGFAWLYLMQQNNFGACLADDMGLGKTLQTITLLQKTINERRKKPIEKIQENKSDLFDFQEDNNFASKPSLVICPVSLIHNWENELKKFSPNLKVLIYHGYKRHAKIKYIKNNDIILTGYGIVRNDIEIFKKIDFLYAILDESQFIKNPNSKTHKAINFLVSEHKLILTGTPVENSLLDLWSQMNFINDGILGDLKFFKSNFLQAIEKENNESRHDKLKKLIKPFIMRRLKEEVAKDLPPLTEQIISCNMTEEQATVYEQEKSKIRNKLIEQIDTGKQQNSSLLIIQALTQLRQIANHPKLTNKDYKYKSGKFNDAVQTIETLIAEKHKVLIFSSFVKHLQLFADYFEEKKFRYSMLTGKVRNRKAVIDDFQNNAEIRLFLISIKAGGTGLNLTEADYVMILDPWWNPAVERQAINRAHRIGQDKKVMVYKYITKNTVEERIKIMQEKKQLLSDSLITTESPLTDLSVEKIMDLLK